VASHWGILSTARINELVLAGARKSDRVVFDAVASRDRDRAEAYAQANGIGRAYGSYDELLADGSLEAVYISLPNDMHVEWSIRALEAGKHVLCEKPLATDPADAAHVFDVADENGLHLMEGFMWLHHPLVARVRQLVDQGAIGDLRLIRAAFSFPADAVTDARLLNGPDGGSLLDVGCYCVHASRHLAGEPEQVFAEAVVNGAGMDVRFAATLSHPGGILSLFDSALDLPVREELELVGAEGQLVVIDPWHAVAPGIELRREDGSERIPVTAADSYQLELENLAEAIAGGADPLLGRDDAVAQARALAALRRAASEHRSLPL
jgi:predicted dehydrogenase